MVVEERKVSARCEVVKQWKEATWKLSNFLLTREEASWSINGGARLISHPTLTNTSLNTTTKSMMGQSFAFDSFVRLLLKWIINKEFSLARRDGNGFKIFTRWFPAFTRILIFLFSAFHSNTKYFCVGKSQIFSIKSNKFRNFRRKKFLLSPYFVFSMKLSHSKLVFDTEIN